MNGFFLTNFRCLERSASVRLVNSEVHLGTAGNRDPFSLCYREDESRTDDLVLYGPRQRPQEVPAVQ